MDRNTQKPQGPNAANLAQCSCLEALSATHFSSRHMKANASKKMGVVDLHMV